MLLLTKELKDQLPALGEQDGQADPVVYVKYFHPMANWTWYATEYDPATRTFFGFVDGDVGEWGYFSLAEMESVIVRGLGIERDLHFSPKAMSEVVKTQHFTNPPVIATILALAGWGLV